MKESTLYRGDLPHPGPGEEGYLPPYTPKVIYPKSKQPEIKAPPAAISDTQPVNKPGERHNLKQPRYQVTELPSGLISALPTRVTSRGLPTVPCMGASQFFIQHCVLARVADPS